MSLTSNLKDKNSLIKQMFDNNFNNIDLFLKEENIKLKNLQTILPINETNYPWATVGHITEYLLALHMGLPIEKLFPMEWLAEFNNSQYQKIKSFNIKKEHLESEYLPGIISITLYHLALYETELRTKGEQAIYRNQYKLSNVATQDIINIYKNSLKNFPDGNYGYNPTFDEKFTQYIGGADADLIQYKDSGNSLIDVKTTKTNKLEKYWIFQLMGYIALDKQDEHNLKNIGIYFPRQNKMLEYNIEDILQKYTKLKSIKELRNAFGYALITQTFPQLMEEKNIIRFNVKK